MNTVLVIALALAMAATLFALIRGIISFLQVTKEELNAPEGSGPGPSRLKQNKMMLNRVLFQAGAIIIVAIMLLAKGNS
ncbi:twin transmembrane helix small protein [Sphingobium terrigena]|uniref:Twin transmembrane helix small protein n=1 Tax=Sphingobium terrigena TaxID=2304063 RepID=A0A418YUE8_9SPHN|nr:MULTISPECIES: twin transmembrane helix small protein [Sphingobium]MBV2150917.1 twin transmembrane helix small protein [Sphingobium sp. AS12]RJG55782.1 twin transmembrane helix small protein [Sphingobium terrigena]